MSRKAHVLQQLRQLSPQYGLVLKGDNAWIRCPWHKGGREKTPSLQITLKRGRFKEGAWCCYGCGVQSSLDGGGTWNNLADKIGAESIGAPKEGEYRPNYLTEREEDEEDGVNYDENALDDGLDDDTSTAPPASRTTPEEHTEPVEDGHPDPVSRQSSKETEEPEPEDEDGEEEDSGAPLPSRKQRHQFPDYLGEDFDDEKQPVPEELYESWPLWREAREWRSISGKTLRAVGARRATDPYGRRRLWLPVFVNGVLYSSIYCTYDKPAKGPAYIYDGAKTIHRAVFPYDLVKSMNKDYVVVVEGSRDALHLIDHDVPAVAILGGNTSWNKEKRDLIMTLSPRLIVLAPDPDEVGDKLAMAMEDSFYEVYGTTRWFRMRSEMVNGEQKKIEDPGNLSDSRIRKLKSNVQLYLERQRAKREEREQGNLPRKLPSMFRHCGDD